MKSLISSLVILLAMAGTASAQLVNPHRFDRVLTRGLGLQTNVVPFAQIFVCAAPSTGTPCSPATPIYYDEALTQQVQQPLIADKNGSYSYYVPPAVCVDEFVSSLGQGSFATYNICPPQRTSGLITFQGRAGNAAVLLPADVQGTLTPQTNCNVVGTAYSPQSGTCISVPTLASTSAILKGNGSGSAVAATPGTDYPGLATANTFSSLQTFGNATSTGTLASSTFTATNSTITNDTVTTFIGQSTNSVLNEEAFPPLGGPSTNIITRVNAAVAACGATNPCVVTLPPNAPAGQGWALPLPNNVTLIDQRGINSQGFAVGTAPGLRSVIQYNMYRGTDLAYEEDESGTGTFTADFEASAYSGGHAGDGGKANSGALLVFSNRTAGNRPIWGEDLNIQCFNLTNLCTGFEVDVVNNSGIDDTGATMQGVLIIASNSGTGGNLGTGLTVQGSGAAWKFGAVIASYNTAGLQMIPGHSRNSDISFVPPADDTNIEIVGRNAANSANVWTINDVGSLTTTGNIVGAIFAPTAWVDSPLYKAGGTSGFTGTCAPTTTATVKGGIITGCS